MCISVKKNNHILNDRSKKINMIPIFIPESLECGANIRSEAHLYSSLIHKLINAHIWVGGDNPSRQPSTSKNTQISIFYPSGTFRTKYWYFSVYFSSTSISASGDPKWVQVFSFDSPQHPFSKHNYLRLTFTLIFSM